MKVVNLIDKIADTINDNPIKTMIIVVIMLIILKH